MSQLGETDGDGRGRAGASDDDDEKRAAAAARMKNSARDERRCGTGGREGEGEQLRLLLLQHH